MKRNSRSFLLGLAQCLVLLSLFVVFACEAPVSNTGATTTISKAARGEWAPNVAYATGDTVTYQGVTYTCLQGHTSLTGWEPPNVPALWQPGGSSVTPTPTPAVTPTPTPVSGQPDLIVTNVTWSPSSISAGTAVTFTVTIKNQGGSATPAGTKIGIAYLVDGTKVSWTGGYFPNPGLGAGASITLNADGGPTGASTWSATNGTHTVTAQVDDVSLIAESNEGNNTSAGKSLTVGTTNTPTPTPTPTPNQIFKDNADNYSPGSGYSMVWSDEFNGTSLDTSVWSYDVGNGGWGNNELEYYTAGNNVSFPNGDNSNRYLAITARQEPMGGSNYTSARLKTQDKKTFTFGPGKTLKYAARIKLPSALTGGVWPAFWMLGNNIGSVGWPKCGEIDIMEAGMNGTPATQVEGTLHWGETPTNHPMYGLTKNASDNLGNAFHYFEATINDASITISLDGQQYFIMNNDVQNAGYYYFKHDFFFLLNLAIGGNFPWPVTASFPQTMLVDWVRVYSN